MIIKMTPIGVLVFGIATIAIPSARQPMPIAAPAPPLAKPAVKSDKAFPSRYHIPFSCIVADILLNVPAFHQFIMPITSISDNMRTTAPIPTLCPVAIAIAIPIPTTIKISITSCDKLESTFKKERSDCQADKNFCQLKLFPIHIMITAITRNSPSHFVRSEWPVSVEMAMAGIKIIRNMIPIEEMIF